jgi:hypothetical protein
VTFHSVNELAVSDHPLRCMTRGTWPRPGRVSDISQAVCGWGEVAAIVLIIYRTSKLKESPQGAGGVRWGEGGRKDPNIVCTYK